jgi:hypothetical protein
MDPADAAGARMLGVDVGRAERVVWLVKVPAFVSGQWQALPLLQERATARARAEPVLVQVITAALRCAPVAPAKSCALRVPDSVSFRSLHSSSELAAGWDNARKADDFQRLLRCERCCSGVRLWTRLLTCEPCQRPGQGWKRPRRCASATWHRVTTVRVASAHVSWLQPR